MQIGPAGGTLPSNPFCATPEQRAAWARERFFEHGVRPTGLVSEPVIQSWVRCLHHHLEPQRAPVFNFVTPSRMHSVLARNRLLLDTAAADLQRLHLTLAGTTTVAILVDPHGIVVHSTRHSVPLDEHVLPLAARVGINLSEEAVGTNAPGLTAHTGVASTVMGLEHFAAPVSRVYCAAAPIRDAQRRLCAVLDLSNEGQPHTFDAAAVAGLYATAIENRLLCAMASGQLVVRMQVEPSLIGSPLVGLVAIDGEGRVAWVNDAAAALLGLAAAWPLPAGLDAEHTLGQRLPTLLAWTRESDAVPVRLPGGLTVWLRCTLLDGRRGICADELPAVAAPGYAAPGHEPAVDHEAAAHAGEAGGAGTLRERDRHLVTQTLQACGGNVSRAARRLGVSRGLIYRHLRKAQR